MNNNELLNTIIDLQNKENNKSSKEEKNKENTCICNTCGDAALALRLRHVQDARCKSGDQNEQA